VNAATTSVRLRSHGRNSFFRCLSGNFIRHIFGLTQHAPAAMIVLLAILMLSAVAAADGGLLEKYANAPGNVYHGR